MASRDTRARIAAAGDLSLCPLPQVPLDQGEFAAALEAVCHGAHVLSAVMRDGPQGQPEVIAEGDESPVAMRQQGEGQGESGTERRLMGRAVRQAQAAEAALRARVAKALALLEARKQRGRGTKRFATVSALRPAVVAIMQRDSVEDLLWFRLNQYDTPRLVRAYRGQLARVDHDRHATVEVRVDEAAVEATMHRVGWRVYGTNQPGESLSLAPAVRASRSA